MTKSAKEIFDEIMQRLTQQGYGEILSLKEMSQVLGNQSVDGIRKAIQRKTFPVVTFKRNERHCAMKSKIVEHLTQLELDSTPSHGERHV